MSKKEALPVGTVNKNTAIVMAMACLVVGFIGGIVLSAYKSSSMTAAPPAMPPQQQAAAPSAGPSVEESSRMLALEKELAANPQNATAWAQLGNIYFDTHQFQKAIDAYQKSLAINPQNADVLTDMGVMFRRNGQPQKAIESFDRAIQVDPRHEISRFNKGVVLMHDLKDDAGALKAWEGLVAMNPSAKAPNGILVKDMLGKLRQNAK